MDFIYNLKNFSASELIGTALVVGLLVYGFVALLGGKGGKGGKGGQGGSQQ